MYLICIRSLQRCKVVATWLISSGSHILLHLSCLPYWSDVMKSTSLLIILMAFGSIGRAQMADPSVELANTIQASTIKQLVYYLASDSLEGRETGTEGNKKAAAYIAAQFASYGIPPIPGDGDYFQEVGFTSFKWDNITMTASGQPYEHTKDFLCIPQSFPVQQEDLNISSLTFLGYGIDDEAYSDYKGVDVRGKHLLVYGGEPLTPSEKYLITGSDSASVWSYDPTLKVEAEKRAGAASLWIIEGHFKEYVMFARKRLLSGSVEMKKPEDLNEFIPWGLLSPALGETLAGDKVKKLIKTRDKITRTGKPARMTLPSQVTVHAVQRIETIPGSNVLGYIEGTDPSMKDEVLVVSAHYDHLGIRGSNIFHGADDNASGTSAVLEIAQAFSEAKQKGIGPRRSVLCMLVTGEEKGLLGSQYYSEHPVFPLANTIADVNIDMIGRMDSNHQDSLYTYVIGADRLSTELHEINEAANAKYTHLALDYTYNAPDDPNQFYYRSDHYNFAKNGIPAIFFFSGVHDDYHRPTDTPDKIMYGKAEIIARLAFHTAWELANRDKRIVVNVTDKN